MVIIESANGKKKDINCIGCALQNGQIEVIGGKVFDGKYFDITQDYEIPIPGFMVLSSKRHVTNSKEFNDDEKKEFDDVIPKLFKAIRISTDTKEVQMLVSYKGTKGAPSHFHVALLPRYEWMTNLSLKDIFEKGKKDKNLDKVKDVIKKIKESLDNYHE